MRREIMSASLQMPMEDEILKDCRYLLEKYYYIGVNDDAAWSELIDAARSGYSKYENTGAREFAKSMYITVLSRIEELSKEKKGL